MLSKFEEAMRTGESLEPTKRTAWQLRIGVNLGDVVVSGSDLLGDGVSIAAAPGKSNRDRRRRLCISVSGPTKDESGS